MTLDTFFKKFDQFADAPNAVAKMRELVLEMAVQGKLVEPPSKPETDRAWLTFKKEISERICSYDSGPPPPFDIPEHWEWSVLGEVAKPCGQKTPDDDFTYIDVGSIDNARGELKPDLNTIEVTHAPSRARKLARTGSVIYATVRPYLKNIAVIEKEFCPPAIISTAFAILHPLQFVESRYLFYWLRSSAFEREVSAYAKGVAYPAISDGDLKRCVIPVPPPSEQKRIVAKVDELMALCDRLEAQQQQREEQASALARASLARFAEAPTPANLNLLFHKSYSITPADLRKAILTLAVQGRLLPQDSKDESVDNLLKRCLSERTKLKRTTATAVQTISAENALGYSIPVSWRWQTLDDLLIVGPTNGFSPKAVDYETPVRSLTLSATTSGRFKGEHSKFIEMDLADDADLWLRDGDILVQRGNTLEYVGVPAVYRGEPNQFIYPDLMMKLRVSSAFDVGYIHLAMSHEASRDFLRARASGTSGSMPKINQTALKSLPLPIPPLAEQRRIVAKVDQVMALVDQLETQLAASRATAKNLLESLIVEITQL
jgi:type I restriction enzyme S subunit